MRGKEWGQVSAELQVKVSAGLWGLLEMLDMGRAWQGLLLLPSCSATSNSLPLLPLFLPHLLIKNVQTFVKPVIPRELSLQNELCPSSLCSLLSAQSCGTGLDAGQAALIVDNIPVGLGINPHTDRTILLFRGTVFCSSP